MHIFKQHCVIFCASARGKPNQNPLILTVLFWDWVRMCEQRTQSFTAAVPPKLPNRPHQSTASLRLWGGFFCNSPGTAKCIRMTFKVWEKSCTIRESKITVVTATLCCQCNILCRGKKKKKKVILMPILQLLPVSWQHRAELNVLAIQLLTSLHLSLSTVAEWNALGGQIRIHLR